MAFTVASLLKEIYVGKPQMDNPEDVVTTWFILLVLNNYCLHVIQADSNPDKPLRKFAISVTRKKFDEDFAGQLKYSEENGSRVSQIVNQIAERLQTETEAIETILKMQREESYRKVLTHYASPNWDNIPLDDYKISLSDYQLLQSASLMFRQAIEASFQEADVKKNPLYEAFCMAYEYESAKANAKQQQAEER
jgi:hypothetical protein